MGTLDFLKKLSLSSNEAVKPAAAKISAGRVQVERNPTNADIRVFKDGSVYPSMALIDSMDLNYYPKLEKGVEGPVGNGFDVFTSKVYPNSKDWPQHVIFIALVSRIEPKLDLFGSTKFKEDNTPASDVASQGAKTFGTQLLEMIEDIYGIAIGDRKFIDLIIDGENAMNTDDNLYYIPKVVSRGDKKGKATIIVREDLTLFPLVPAEIMQTVAKAIEEVEPATEEAKVPQKSISDALNEVTNTVVPSEEVDPVAESVADQVEKEIEAVEGNNAIPEEEEEEAPKLPGNFGFGISPDED